MKTRTAALPIATFLIGCLLGGFIIAADFLENVIPDLSKSLTADVWSIKFSEGAKPYDYADVLGEYNLAQAYLWQPMYFYKRKVGYEMLESLATEGYTPAVHDLYGYHVNRMHYYSAKENADAFNKHYELAAHWAKVAADQGDERLLMMFITVDGFGLQEDVSEELKILDKWVEKSSLNTAPKIMATYYEKVGNKEKSIMLWEEYEKRSKTPRTPPACTTITPWRGF